MRKDDVVLIEYKNRKIEKICTNAYEAERRHGREMAEKIHMRIGQLKAADSVEMLIQFRIGRCHELKGERRKQYAMDLVHPYRLVFEKKENEIKIVNVLEIVDYHD